MVSSFRLQTSELEQVARRQLQPARGSIWSLICKSAHAQTPACACQQAVRRQSQAHRCEPADRPTAIEAAAAGHMWAASRAARMGAHATSTTRKHLPPTPAMAMDQIDGSVRAKGKEEKRQNYHFTWHSTWPIG
uniref:Uncharacterized protein n=1 Tax=Oryza barthii TaxID=65489 RepID=A0A0D3HHM7_9ORYZ